MFDVSPSFDKQNYQICRLNFLIKNGYFAQTNKLSSKLIVTPKHNTFIAGTREGFSDQKVY